MVQILNCITDNAHNLTKMAINKEGDYKRIVLVPEVGEGEVNIKSRIYGIIDDGKVVHQFLEDEKIWRVSWNCRKDKEMWDVISTYYEGLKDYK